MGNRIFGLGLSSFLLGVSFTCGCAADDPADGDSTASEASASDGDSTDHSVDGTHSTSDDGVSDSTASSDVATDDAVDDMTCVRFRSELPDGVRYLFQPADSDNSTWVTYRVLGINEDLLYVTEGNEVKSVTLDTGAVTTVYDFGDGPEPLAVHEDKYVFSAASEQEGHIEYSVALREEPSAVTLVATIPPQSLVEFGREHLFFRDRDANSIWSAPWSGEGAAELVTGESLVAMLEHEGYLYWLASSTNVLRRIPVEGGEAETLVGVFHGGPMAAEGSDIYHSDISLRAVKRYTLGQESDQTLFRGESLNRPEQISVRNGSAYFLVGSICRNLWTSSGPDQQRLLVRGFDDADFLAATSYGIVVGDEDGVYIVSLE